MKKQEILFEIQMDILDFKGVKLEIEYSGGESENEIEFECVKISKKNGFTEEVLEEIQEELECGFEERVLSFLEKHYENSGVKFTYEPFFS